MNPSTHINPKTKQLISAVQYLANSKTNLAEQDATLFFEASELPPNTISFLEVITALLADPEVNIYVQDATGWPTIIMSAVENAQVLQLMLQHRPDLAHRLLDITGKEPDTRPTESQTPAVRAPIIWDPFTWAGLRGHGDSLKHLFSIKTKKLTPEVMKNKKKEIVDRFLKQDLQLSSIREQFLNTLSAFEPSDLTSILHQTVKANHFLALSVLTQVPNIDLNAIDIYAYDNLSPLYRAVQSKHSCCVEALVATGKIDVNTCFDFHKTPLLVIAAEKGDAVSIKALLSAHADPNAKDMYGRTALMAAAQAGQAACVKILLEVSDVNACNEDGDTALMLACSTPTSPGDTGNSADTIAELLKSPHIEVNKKGRFEHTALIHAVISRDVSHVIELLKNPTVDANIADKEGNTALIYNTFHADTQDILTALLTQSNIDLFAHGQGAKAVTTAKTKYSSDAIKVALEQAKKAASTSATPAPVVRFGHPAGASGASSSATPAPSNRPKPG